MKHVQQPCAARCARSRRRRPPLTSCRRRNSKANPRSAPPVKPSLLEQQKPASRPGSRPPSGCRGRPRPSDREYSGETAASSPLRRAARAGSARLYLIRARRRRLQTAYPSGRRPTPASSAGCPAAVPAPSPAPSSAGRRRPLFSISCTSSMAWRLGRGAAGELQLNRSCLTTRMPQKNDGCRAAVS